jgi:cobalt-precorrin-5B (C1)-methyltransferase
MGRKPEGQLRKGWTTGACAAAAARAAFQALLTGQFPDPVSIRLPRGETPSFPLAQSAIDATGAVAGIVKDAGDDPDVTHGALVLVRVAKGLPGSGIVFHAGDGVGTVTRPGLALAVGEPAINPAPRQMIRDALHDVADCHSAACDVGVTISIPGGAELAARTMNERLGIKGGLSILGTTGIVIPYSCASWIHSIHRGIDVARAAGLTHVAGSTGRTSEAAVQKLYALPDHALIDMGDFVGAMLKYLRRYPIPRLTIAGGFAKLSKLANGHLDLHSSRTSIESAALGELLAALGADAAIVEAARQQSSAAEILQLSGARRFDLADAVAKRAREVVLATLAGDVDVEVVIVDRDGAILGRTGL